MKIGVTAIEALGVGVGVGIGIGIGFFKTSTPIPTPTPMDSGLGYFRSSCSRAFGAPKRMKTMERAFSPYFLF